MTAGTPPGGTHLRNLLSPGPIKHGLPMATPQPQATATLLSVSTVPTTQDTSGEGVTPSASPGGWLISFCATPPRPTDAVAGVGTAVPPTVNNIPPSPRSPCTSASALVLTRGRPAGAWSRVLTRNPEHGTSGRSGVGLRRASVNALGVSWALPLRFALTLPWGLQQAGPRLGLPGPTLAEIHALHPGPGTCWCTRLLGFPRPTPPFLNLSSPPGPTWPRGRSSGASVTQLAAPASLWASHLTPAAGQAPWGACQSTS